MNVGPFRSSLKLTGRKAFKALKAWVTEFRSIARIAFKDNPQVLEAFGMVVSSKV